MSRRKEIPTNYLDPEEATGVPALPLSTIKRTIKADEEIHLCNKTASFAITIAAEMFIQYLTEQGVKALASEKKQRKTLQYKDLASAVARIDNLEFLADVIPPIIANKPVRETKTAKSKKKQVVDSKQLTLSGQRLVPVVDKESLGTASGTLEPNKPSEEQEQSPKDNSDAEVGKTVDQGKSSTTSDTDINMT
ncbi:histone-fold-containing protein [Geopyxis carbonaria]|nr:histone-fold-containing protein [Geopyxis carbonaria]